jgi:hypothetical protein
MVDLGLGEQVPFVMILLHFVLLLFAGVFLFCARLRLVGRIPGRSPMAEG